MIVDNGERRHLSIPGVFEGEAGVRMDILAFVPNRNVRRAELARDGTLDGVPIAFERPRRSPDGKAYVVRFWQAAP